MNRLQIILITGNMAAGKSSVAQALPMDRSRDRAKRQYAALENRTE